MEKRSLNSKNPNIMENIKNTPSKNTSNNKINFLLLALIIIVILYLYWFYFRDMFDSSIRLPHAYNEDDGKLLNKEKDSPVIGMKPVTHQNIYEFSDEEKEHINQDFYTVSDLMNNDIYFSNNKEIKIKDYNDNCKEVYDEMEPGIYADCLKKAKLIKTDKNIIGKEYHNINIYANEKIMNGGEFMDGITGI